jgi:hypothetical protein
LEPFSKTQSPSDCAVADMVRRCKSIGAALCRAAIPLKQITAAGFFLSLDLGNVAGDRTLDRVGALRTPPIWISRWRSPTAPSLALAKIPPTLSASTESSAAPIVAVLKVCAPRS